MSNAAVAKGTQIKGSSKRPRKTTVPREIMVPRVLLIAFSVILMCIGLVMIYSASSITALNDFGDAAYYLKHQIVFIVVGLVMAAIMAAIPYNVWISRISWVPWILLMLLLLVVAVLGHTSGGAQRWLVIGGSRFQPSEFAKVVVLLLLGSLVTQYKSGALSFKYFSIYAAVAVLGPCALIIIQPDLGTTIIVVLIALLVLWFGELDFRPVFVLCGLAAAVAVLATITSPYRMKRVQSMLDPWSDPTGDGWQIINSLYAFGSGGLFGVGLGLSKQKFAWLPEAHTDFIFAVIGEELGMFGAIAVVLLFIGFIYAGIQISRHASTLMGRIIAGSATSVIGAQAFLNMACTLGIFPVTGKPLPFISAGGSSIMSTLMLVGLILSVSYHNDLSAQRSRGRDDLRILDGGGSSSRQAVRDGGGSSYAAASMEGVSDVSSRRASSDKITRGIFDSGGIPRASSYASERDVDDEVRFDPLAADAGRGVGGDRRYPDIELTDIRDLRERGSSDRRASSGTRNASTSAGGTSSKAASRSRGASGSRSASASRSGSESKSGSTSKGGSTSRSGSASKGGSTSRSASASKASSGKGSKGGSKDGSRRSSGSKGKGES